MIRTIFSIRFLWLALAAVVSTGAAGAQPQCVATGEWVVPGSGRVAAGKVLSQAAGQAVVLLGEEHDNAAHHLWELQTIATLTALRGKAVLGFEMFPRRVQPVLDRWVAGKLNEAEFLAATDWAQVWGFDPNLYMALFRFARLNRIPMIALNVDDSFARAVMEHGFDSVPIAQREGITTPAPASPAYLDRLFAVFKHHPQIARHPSRDGPEFKHFVQGQLLWDRAFAQALAKRAEREPSALVIGIMGSGHVAYAQGAQHQLRSLGVTAVTSLLPWDKGRNCADLTPGLATAVFGVPAPLPTAPKQLLGITIRTVRDGVRVLSVRPGSIAEATGLAPGDIIAEAAGAPVVEAASLRAAVEGVEPGTWLPLRVRRHGETVDMLAKFPRTRGPAPR